MVLNKGLYGIRPPELTVVIAGWWDYRDFSCYFLLFCKCLKFSIMTCQHADQQIKSSLGWLSFTLRRQVTHSCTALRSSERSASYAHTPPPHWPSRLPHCLLCLWCLFFSLSEAPPQTSPATALCSFLLLPWAEYSPSLIVLTMPFVGFSSVAQSWLAIPFSSGPHSVRILYHDPSVSGGPTWHGS